MVIGGSGCWGLIQRGEGVGVCTQSIVSLCEGNSGLGVSYLRLIDFVFHSTVGLRVTKKRKKVWGLEPASARRYLMARVLGLGLESGFRVCLPGSVRV